MFIEGARELYMHKNRDNLCMTRLKIKEIGNEEVNEFFNNDPSLVLQGLPDNTLVQLYQTQEYEKDIRSEFLGIYYEEELVLIFKYEYFTDISINIHPYLKTKYQHTNLFDNIQEALKYYFIKNTTIKKAIVMTPSTCVHIPPTCEKFGFKKEGHISKCLTWRQEIVDVLIYGLDLTQDTQ